MDLMRNEAGKFVIVFLAIWSVIAGSLAITHSGADSLILFAILMAFALVVLGVLFVLVYGVGAVIKWLARSIGWTSGEAPPAEIEGTTLAQDFAGIGRILFGAFEAIYETITRLLFFALMLALCFGVLVLLFKVVRWAWALSA